MRSSLKYLIVKNYLETF